jgi:hypothetical protein
MIGRYERNEAMPGSAVLIALADALEVFENYLLDQSDLRLEAVEFRKNRIMNRMEEASVEATVLDAVERYLTIEDLVGATSADRTPPAGALFPVRSDLPPATPRRNGSLHRVSSSRLRLPGESTNGGNQTFVALIVRGEKTTISEHLK